MKGKKIGGYVLLVIGILLVALGFYVKGEVTNAEHSIDKVEGFVPFSPIKTLSQDKIDQYKKLYKWSFGGGILLSIVGIGMVMTSKKR